MADTETKTITISVETYRALARRIQEFGETPEDIIKRLLLIAEESEGSQGVAIGEMTKESPIVADKDIVIHASMADLFHQGKLLPRLEPTIGYDEIDIHILLALLKAAEESDKSPADFRIRTKDLTWKAVESVLACRQLSVGDARPVSTNESIVQNRAAWGLTRLKKRGYLLTDAGWGQNGLTSEGDEVARFSRTILADEGYEVAIDRIREKYFSV